MEKDLINIEISLKQDTHYRGLTNSVVTIARISASIQIIFAPRFVAWVVYLTFVISPTRMA